MVLVGELDLTWRQVTSFLKLHFHITQGMLPYHFGRIGAGKERLGQSQEWAWLPSLLSGTTTTLSGPGSQVPEIEALRSRSGASSGVSFLSQHQHSDPWGEQCWSKRGQYELLVWPGAGCNSLAAESLGCFWCAARASAHNGCPHPKDATLVLSYLCVSWLSSFLAGATSLQCGAQAGAYPRAVSRDQPVNCTVSICLLCPLLRISVCAFSQVESRLLQSSC